MDDAQEHGDAHSAYELERHREELRKEALTMGLYVAVCLLAALSAVEDKEVGDHPVAFGIVWGTTVGLALAHWFAFRLSARYVAGTARRHDTELAVAQFAGAVVVGLLTSIPILLLPGSSELDVARLDLALLLAVVGYFVARSAGANRVRAVTYGIGVLLFATVVALIKNFLTH